MYGMMLKRLKARPPSTNQRENKRRERVHSTLVTMALVYCLTWIPFFIFTLCVELASIKVHLSYGILRLIGATNALVNPILYGYLNTTFRKYYRHVYRKLPWYTTSVPPGIASGIALSLNAIVKETHIKRDLNHILVPAVQINSIVNQFELTPPFNMYLKRSTSLHCYWSKPKKYSSMLKHKMSTSVSVRSLS